MARFPFSISGRKKQQPAPRLTVTEPMSKAHRILGSTPLSIDAPPNWDDACSSVMSDDRSGTTATSYPDSEARGLYDNHPVGIAKSENGWGDDSDVLPHPLRLNTVDIGDESEVGRTTVSNLLRKSHSSLTIKSWYDKTKLPLAISQQTSSSAMAKGPPSGKAARLLDVDDIHSSSKTRRKPSKLDLSSIVTGSRASRKGSLPHKREVDDLLLGPDYMKSSPSSLSPITPSTRQVQRRRTRESLHSHAAETSRPGTSGTNSSNPWPPKNAALSELPSLYVHYEQMSLRQVMRQDSKPDVSLAVPGDRRLSTAQSQGRRESKALDWIHTDPIPTTSRAALFAKSLEPSSPTNYATSVSSRHTRTSRASRATSRSFRTADLQQTSVLMLSSDSEDDLADGIAPPITTTKSPASIPVRRPSNFDDDIPQLDASRPNTSKESTKSERRSSRSIKSSRSSKRASFAPSNTYITIPSASERTKTPVVDSRSNTPFGNVSQTTSGSLSRRASFMSNYSGNSAMTWQSKSACSIQEARAITMLTARRPSDLELEEQEAAQLLQRMEFDHSVFHRDSVNSSANQLTPPLSPTSVDFYIRSGHSSIDGPGSHNRLMAVTRQEEMLLAALRQKQTYLRGNILAELEEGSEEDEEEQQRTKRESRSPKRQSKGNRSSKASQATITDSTFDFGFPAPPTFKSYSDSSSSRNQSSSRQSSGSRRPSSAVLVNADSQSLRSDSSLSPALALPKSILREPSCESTAEQLQEEVPACLDTDPSPDLSDFLDWEDALAIPSDIAPDSTAWPNHQKDRMGRGRSSVRSNPGSYTALQPDTCSSGGRLAGVVEETSADIEKEEDVPRPDSPISPDSFPAVPEKRTTLSNMARLSAVGPGLLGGLSSTELGWWGDDD
ncbi:hypothetical protein TOPH_07243 [Tolypocladium ophioglossoides CBS 100239]|uniref:Uncharacterized protein n=1 Tax=Tolypocladium ophioglossoides (strain CBS 100239) TaxID=1163406 RepID=A0A0L0N2B1_TOLOC|nr:hypothetical protein TOPH_07243 [Tolypocladium ophioglossoides CBS 100239]